MIKSILKAVGWIEDKPAHSDNNLIALTLEHKHGTWVFTDPITGLVDEPFVAGIPEIIDDALEVSPEERPKRARIIFSANPFPGYNVRLTWAGEEEGGVWYREDNSEKKGWLCPVLFKYFEEAPDEIFALVAPL